MKSVIRAFRVWRLQRPLRQGRGTKDNPLTWNDLRPVMEQLQRWAQEEVTERASASKNREIERLREDDPRR
jgi:hypothetical protein